LLKANPKGGARVFRWISLSLDLLLVFPFSACIAGAPDTRRDVDIFVLFSLSGRIAAESVRPGVVCFGWRNLRKRLQSPRLAISDPNRAGHGDSASSGGANQPAGAS
jgi:hypothetical protein